MNGMDHIRAFIAFNIPETVLAHIRNIQETLSAGGIVMRWTPVGNIHLTLKFLGNIQRTDVEKIYGMMTDAARETPSIQLRTKGLGVFPGIQRPRVLWIGLKGGTPSLIDLQHRLEAGLEDLGYAREARPFKAHLTIGRARGRLNSKKLASLMAAEGSSESPPFAAGELILFQSELFPRGPVYTELKKAPLKVETLRTMDGFKTKK